MTIVEEITITSADAQYFLSNCMDSEIVGSLVEIDSAVTNLSEKQINESLSFIQQIDSQEKCLDNKEVLIKLCAILLSMIKQPATLDELGLAVKSVLSIVSLPAASAIGCRSPPIIRYILLHLYRHVIRSLRNLESDGCGDSFKQSQASQIEESNMSIEEEDMQFDITIEASQGFSQPSTQSRYPQRSTRAKQQIPEQKKNTGKVEKKGFSILMKSFSDHLDIFLESTDEDRLNGVADFLAFSLFLSVVKSELSGSSSIIKDCLRRVAVYSPLAMLAFHKSVVPIMTLNISRSYEVPENQRMRNSCHSECVDLYRELIPHMVNLFNSPQYLPSVATPAVTPAPTPGLDDSRLSVSVSRSTATTPAKLINSTMINHKTPTAPMEDKNIEGDISLAQKYLLGTLQRMVMGCPDRAPLRALVSQSALILATEIYAQLNHKDASIANRVESLIQQFLSFLMKLSKSTRVQFRAFCLEVVCSLVELDDLWGSRSATMDGPQLLVVLMNRCNDASPSVRMKALSALQDFSIKTNDESPFSMVQALHDVVMGTSELNSKSLLDVVRPLTQDTKTLVRSKAIQLYGTLLSKSWRRIVDRSRLGDEFALHLSDDDLSVLIAGSRDSAISVRKQSIVSITSVLIRHEHLDHVQLAWIQAVMPLALDPESTVVQKLAQQFQEVILFNIIAWDCRNPHKDNIGWEIINKIGQLGMIPLMRSLLSFMMRQGLIVFTRDSSKASFYSIMNSCKNVCEAVVESGNNANHMKQFEAAWILMEVIASQSSLRINDCNGQTFVLEDCLKSIGSAEFVINCFKLSRGVSNRGIEDQDIRLLKVLDKLTDSLSMRDINMLTSDIDSLLHNCALSTSMASTIIPLRLQLIKAKVSHGKGSLLEEVKTWVTPLTNLLFDKLNNFAFNESVDSPQINSLAQLVLFVIGELVMLGFKIDEESIKSNFNIFETNPGSLVQVYLPPGGANIRLVFSSKLVDLVKLLMGKTLPNKSGGTRLCAASIRAVAFITVGKMCMRDHVLARDNLNVFLRELTAEEAVENDRQDVSQLTDSSMLLEKGSSRGNSVRNNALLVLGDLCIRHTHLVDRHIDTLACCLQDQDPAIRKNAMILISQLLMQDFVKLKGLLLYRFLMLSVDDDQEIALFAKELLERSLSTKYPGLLVNHVSEAVIILNKCLEHPIYSAVAYSAGADSGRERDDDPSKYNAAGLDESMLDPATKAFHATSNLHRSKRFVIYNFMTNELSDEMKIQVTAKLVNDILASAVDHYQSLLPDRNHLTSTAKKGNGRFGSRSHDLTHFELAIEDVFIFLRSPSLKIGSKRKGNQGDGVDDGIDEPMNDGQGANSSQPLAIAKSKIIKALSSQHLVSHILPVVMSLKHCLEQIKSPLQGALMEFLLSLVKAHNSEVQQALQYDPTLRAEVDYDLRQYERSKKEFKQGTVEKPMRLSSMSPYLEGNKILPSTLQKPLLKSAKKSPLGIANGTTAEASRNTNPDSRSKRLSNTVHFAKNPIEEPEDDDHMLRLTSTSYYDENAFEGNVDDAPQQVLPDANSSRRRSWGIVVASLGDQSNLEEESGKQALLRERRSSNSPVAKKAKRKKSISPSNNEALASWAFPAKSILLDIAETNQNTSQSRKSLEKMFSSAAEEVNSMPPPQPLPRAGRRGASGADSLLSLM